MAPFNMLIDLLTYKPNFLVAASKEAPEILGIVDGEELVENITKVDRALQ